MSSLDGGKRGSLGVQRPRVWSAPKHAASDIDLVDELCGNAGLVLDEWQRFVLEHSLGLRPDGKWAAFQVGVCAPRQNGKNAILEARELAGLFLLGERMIIHSAHQWDTSLEAFRRLRGLIEDTPTLVRHVKSISGTHGQEGIELKNGQRIRFRTRNKSGGGGRGFTADCVVFDEAMHLPDQTYGAILPTLSARPNPQVWCTGSAVDQDTMPDGIVFARLRKSGEAGDGNVAWFEWSIDAENPEIVPDDVLYDMDQLSVANPALGSRITGEYIEANERHALSRRSFAVERGGVGDWPRTDGLGEVVIELEAWDAGTDAASEPLDPVWFAFDVTPTRHKTSVAVAGYRDDGHFHGEVVQQFKGTSGVVDFLVGLVERHDVAGIACDAVSPAAALIPDLEDAGVTVVALSTTEHVRACGVLFDAVDDGRFHHLGTENLRDAIRGAVKRPLGDAWAWSRKNSSVDISPLVAVTLALWGVASEPAPLAADLYAQVF